MKGQQPPPGYWGKVVDALIESGAGGLILPQCGSLPQMFTRTSVGTIRQQALPARIFVCLLAWRRQPSDALGCVFCGN